MEFLSSVCDAQHPSFYQLLGFPVPPKKKTLVKPTRKRVLNKRVYKLPTQPITKRNNQKKQIKQSNNVKKDIIQQLDVKEVEENRIQIEEIVEDSNQIEIVTEKVDVVEELSSISMSEISRERTQKNFFRLAIEKTASDMKRFLRTNVSQIDINEALMDISMQKPIGPFCGWSALHIAAFRGDLDLIKLLLEHGAEINMKATLQSEVCLIIG